MLYLRPRRFHLRSGHGYFENCEIFCRDAGYIAAPNTKAENIGLVFARCRVTFTFGNPPVYLGRPWHESPSATFIQCELGAGIHPAGWKEWNVKPPLVRFAEYECTGPGAVIAARVAWALAPAGPAAGLVRWRVRLPTDRGPSGDGPSKTAALLLGVLLPGLLSAAETPRTFGGAAPLEWSRRLADSEMVRKGDSMFLGGSPRARWDYTTSLFGLSLVKLAERTGQTPYADYGAKTVESFIGADGAITTYTPEDYNLDMIPPGKVLLLRYEQGRRDAQYLKAIKTLRGQLLKHPRTNEGGFWHKQRYPDQMWLDGLFMAAPFLAHYGKVFEEPAAFDEVAKQILLVDRHAFNPQSGLHHHAWDEKREQPWADKATGRSPHPWSRALGWYAMALVDSLDFFSPTHPEVENINEVLRRVADGIVHWQDPATGLWWQVTDQGAREGNYLEATGSSMFVYALAKGINRGYLSREKYLPAVLQGYAGLIRDFIRTGADGRVSLTRCCEVAGLGYTNAAGRARDGSFAYYVSEPIIDNDLKGVGPFILAGLEMEQLLTAAPTPVAVRGWSDATAILARIQAPVFPARDFLLADFGAKPGADASTALKAALAACHAAGGGRVVVPTGEWRTGAVHLLSNVNLHVSQGATLRFSTVRADYPTVYTRWEGVECLNYSPLIYAFEQENIAVTGPGTLDGGATWENWWSWNDKRNSPLKQKPARDRLFDQGERNVPVAERVMGEGSFLRPNFIQPYRCKKHFDRGRDGHPFAHVGAQPGALHERHDPRGKN